MTQTYQGNCHCGAIKFEFEGEEITAALRCTCSLCSRRGAMMTTEAIPEDKLTIIAKDEDLGLYQFGAETAKHYFCKKCGIYTFHMPGRMPGHMRANLGCFDDLDTSNFEVTVFDGKNLL